MANYKSVGRTNYFRVTDEKRWEELFKYICTNDGKCDYSKKADDGTILHCFACEGGLDYIEPDSYDSELDYFIEELQKILPDDEAMIYTEGGHKKHRYVTGLSLVVTSTTIDWLLLPDLALGVARNHLGKDFNTEMTY